MSIRYAGALVVLLAAYFVVYGNTAFATRVYNLDFMAFYCGGQASNEGGDPYLIEPLRACEHSVGTVFRKGSQLAVPDPLPPYDVAFFKAMALLPYRVASPVWTLFVGLICLGTMYFVRRMSALPWYVVAFTLVLSLAYVSAYLGQVAAVSIFGLVLVARGLSRSSFRWTFSGALLASIEPHLALFAMIASISFGGRRVVLGIVAAVVTCGIATFAFVPAPIVSEYFLQVLPAHLLSEINNRDQFGIAYYLHFCGLPEKTAVHVAEGVFIIALAVAIARFRSTRSAFSAEIAVLGGSCFTLVFSPYYHLTQIALAGPLALLVWQKTRGRLAGWSSVLLAIPWLQFSLVVAVAPLAVAAIATLAKRLVGLRPTLGIALGTVGILFCAMAGFEQVRSNPGPLAKVTGSPTALAEVSWRQAVDWSDRNDPYLFMLAKLPDHAALLAISAIPLFARRRDSKRSPSFPISASIKEADYVQ